MVQNIFAKSEGHAECLENAPSFCVFSSITVSCVPCCLGITDVTFGQRLWSLGFTSPHVRAESQLQWLWSRRCCSRTPLTSSPPWSACPRTCSPPSQCPGCSSLCLCLLEASSSWTWRREARSQNPRCSTVQRLNTYFTIVGQLQMCFKFDETVLGYFFLKRNENLASSINKNQEVFEQILCLLKSQLCWHLQEICSVPAICHFQLFGTGTGTALLFGRGWKLCARLKDWKVAGQPEKYPK